MVMKGMYANGRRPFFNGRWSRILWHKKEGLKGKEAGRGWMVRQGFSAVKEAMQRCLSVCVGQGILSFFQFSCVCFYVMINKKRLKECR